MILLLGTFDILLHKAKNKYSFSVKNHMLFESHHVYCYSSEWHLFFFFNIDTWGWLQLTSWPTCCLVIMTELFKCWFFIHVIRFECNLLRALPIIVKCEQNKATSRPERATTTTTGEPAAASPTGPRPVFCYWSQTCVLLQENQQPLHPLVPDLCSATGEPAAASPAGPRPVFCYRRTSSCFTHWSQTCVLQGSVTCSTFTLWM